MTLPDDNVDLAPPYRLIPAPHSRCAGAIDTKEATSGGNAACGAVEFGKEADDRPPISQRETWRAWSPRRPPAGPAPSGRQAGGARDGVRPDRITVQGGSRGCVRIRNGQGTAKKRPRKGWDLPDRAPAARVPAALPPPAARVHQVGLCLRPRTRGPLDGPLNCKAEGSQTHKRSVD